MENPYEPSEPGPFRARPRASQRRSSDYHLPPMGNGRIVDQRHFRREAWIGRLVMWLFLGGPLAYIAGLELGIW